MGLLEQRDIGALLRQYGLIGKVRVSDKVAAGVRVGGDAVPEVDEVDEVDEDAVTVVVRKTPPRAGDVL